ncbi:MAG: PD-(D/E)XK nuclease superfamily protein [Pseudomonadota bacterium]
MSGGAEANKSGLTWEAWVKTVAEKQGFSVLNYKFQEKYNIPIEQRRIIWTHVPYKTIFHNIKNPSKASTEYVVECGEQKVRIECKWQSTAGSVDEKYPFMYLNAVLTMEEETVVFALGGEYFESGKGKEVRDWLIKVCKSPPNWFSDKTLKNLEHRELIVLTPSTFAKWFRQKFPR